MTKIGLIGCGAIGSEIAAEVSAGRVGSAVLVALYDMDAAIAGELSQRLGGSIPTFTDMDAFLSTPQLEMVVECASPSAVKAHAEKVLDAGKDLLVISSGALTDTALFQRLAEVAREKGLRFIIPTGALGGIDAIRATQGLLEEVVLTTTKPPQGLKGAPGFQQWESADISEAKVIFDGSALEAIKLFPANVNVGATLSLAGLGPEKTRVKVVADPDSPGNVHQIYARGSFGVMRFTLENRPHDRNPRTSYLAILSVLETLREACTAGPRIGT